MSATIPSDTHLVSDTGHTVDHNNIADVLSLYAQALAGMVNVSGASNAASIAAIQGMVASQIAASGWPVQILPSGDTTGVKDTAAINNALTAAAPSGRVELVPGQWYINAPLVVPSGVFLLGSKGGINGGTATNPQGTVLNVVAAFAQGGAAKNAAISMAEVTTTTASQNCRVENLAIVGSSAPANVDGIAMTGAVNGVALGNLSVYGVPGRGIAWYAGGTGNNADGFWGSRIMIQKPGKTGMYRIPSDSNVHNVHVQYGGNAGGANIDGSGFYVTNGGNIFFVGCRADLCNSSGWYLDHYGGGSGYTDAIRLTGCGTQRNRNHGVWITNSSATGNQWRDPIVISGCHFGEDGHNNGTGGSFAGIFVEGQNLVFISGTSIGQGTIDYASGCPKFGLLTATIGTAVAAPQIITWTGGFINYSTVAGGLPYSDAGGTSFLYFSPDMTAIPGYDAATVFARQGPVTLNGTTAVTVTNPWITTATRLLISTVNGSGTVGSPYVASRAAGSMTVKSTTAGDTSLAAWALIGG